MGKKKPTTNPLSPSGLADSLFTPVQQRVLGLLFGQPGRRYMSAELIRLAGSGTGATHRVLKRLTACGLVTEHSEGRQKYYQAAADSPVFEELCGLIRKTVGLVEPLRSALQTLASSVDAAFVYGSVASGEDRAGSDVDLMVIASALDYSTLYETLQLAEDRLARKVNPTLMTPAEWRRKLRSADSFAARVHRGARLMVLGDAHDLERT